MQNDHLTWDVVDRVAVTLGAKAEACRKWRQRRVPHNWRARIIDHLAIDGVAVRFADFDVLSSEQDAAA
ncbi:MAG: hypothetical protein CMG78_09480 [Marinobacter sp.]|nr:hypothetical protein [Marinobacter sp.]